MNTININLKTIKNSISVGRQFDHNITKLHFEGLEPNVSYQLLIDLEPYGASKPTLISLVDDEWLISNTYTQNSGVFPCQLLAFVNNEWKQYSQIFSLILDNSLGNGVPKEDIPPRFETKFNDMVNLINQVQTKLNNGEFIGDSAYELATKNGYKGTEQEWLESLKYQHSVEFSELAKQVRLNAQQVNADKLQVNTDKAQVNNDKLQVSADKTQVAQDKQQVEAKALEVNNKALQVNQDKVHIDNVVKEFDTKVTQTNIVIDDKVKQASDSANLSKQSADSVQASASQIDKNKDDILKLAIKPSVSGNPCVINDSSEYDLLGLEVYGQSEQNGVPTPDAPVEIVSKEVSEIKVTGSNLCMGNLKAFFGGQDTQRKIQVDGNAEMFYLKVIKGEKYTIGCDVKGDRQNIGYTGNTKPQNETPITNLGSFFNNTFIAKETGWCCLYINSTRNDGIAKSFRVSIGDKAFPYEPYKEQTITLTQPITLRGLKSEQGNVDINGVKYISDVICERNGVIGVERNIKDFLLTSDLRYDCDLGKYGAIEVNTILTRYVNNVIKKKGVCLSNYLSRDIRNWGIDRESFDTTKQSIDFRLNRSLLGLSSNTTIVENEQAVKKYLATHPINCIVELNTPTFEPLPQADQDNIKSLKSYYPNTIINTNAFTQAQYVADTKNYIDNSIAKYHAQTQAQQVAMMSLLPDETQATMIEKDQQNLLGGI